MTEPRVIELTNWLAQNTVEGHHGVEWDIVHDELIATSWADSDEKFRAIAEDRIKIFGGVTS